MIDSKLMKGTFFLIYIFCGMSLFSATAGEENTKTLFNFLGFKLQWVRVPVQTPPSPYEEFEHISMPPAHPVEAALPPQSHTIDTTNIIMPTNAKTTTFSTQISILQQQFSDESSLPDGYSTLSKISQDNLTKHLPLMDKYIARNPLPIPDPSLNTPVKSWKEESFYVNDSTESTEMIEWRKALLSTAVIGHLKQANKLMEQPQLYQSLKNRLSEMHQELRRATPKFPQIDKMLAMISYVIKNTPWKIVVYTKPDQLPILHHLVLRSMHCLLLEWPKFYEECHCFPGDENTHSHYPPMDCLEYSIMRLTTYAMADQVWSSCVGEHDAAPKSTQHYAQKALENIATTHQDSDTIIDWNILQLFHFLFESIFFIPGMELHTQFTSTDPGIQTCAEKLEKSSGTLLKSLQPLLHNTPLPSDQI